MAAGEVRALRARAEDPVPGDVVVLMTGHVTYRVLGTTVTGVWACRTAVREPVYEGEAHVSIPREVWRDLVTYGGAS